MTFDLIFFIMPTTAHLNQDSHIVGTKLKKKLQPLLLSAKTRLLGVFFAWSLENVIRND